MTDVLLQKVEEKVMVLLSEIEASRKEIAQLRQEASSLRAEKSNNTSKLQGLISLLDVLDFNEVRPLQSNSTTQQEESVVC